MRYAQVMVDFGHTCATLLLVCGLLNSASAAGSLTLVEGGKPTAQLVLPANPSAADTRAADILESSIHKMTGATLPVITSAVNGTPTIWIGFDPNKLPANLKPDSRPIEDGFYLASNGNNLYIVSGGGKGSVYGVVQLLEKQFGCRKFSPTAELFPAHKNLQVQPIKEEENPANSFRCINGDFEQDQDYLDWMRLNTVNEIYANGYYVHTFGKLVPPSTYFAAHPEYFALVDGKRHQEQLCPSNPEVVDLIVAKLKQEMAAQPDKKVWCVSQNDNQTYCQCPDCEKVIQEEGSPAGPIIRLVNKVAAQFPDKTIATLAYQFSRAAPKLTRPAKNVMVMLCTIELNRSKPIATDPSSQDFVRDIEDWGRICDNIYLWDYTVDFNHFVSPFPNIQVLQPNLQFFGKNGAHKQFQQSNTGVGHEFSELKSYLIAHLLWNPNADAKQIIDDFLSGYYGKAAPFLRSYIEMLHQELERAGTRLDIYEPPTAHAADFLSLNNVRAYNDLFDKAEAAVGQDQMLLQRVKTARLPLEYAMIQIASDDISGPRGFYSNSGGKKELRPEMVKVLDEFHETCGLNHVKTLNESGLTPDAYYQATKQLLNLQIEGNLAFGRPAVAVPPPSPKYGHGDVGLLTNGVLGGSDFKVQWLGWEGEDFDVSLDLGAGAAGHSASLDTIYMQRSWILHPTRVTCFVSADGQNFEEAGSESVDGDQRDEPLIKNFSFRWAQSGIRFLRFHFDTMKGLPAWHSAAGGKPWVFVDEITVH